MGPATIPAVPVAAKENLAGEITALTCPSPLQKRNREEERGWAADPEKISNVPPKWTSLERKARKNGWMDGWRCGGGVVSGRC